MGVIWLAEDDPQLSALMAMVLSGDGHQVTAFGLGGEILPALAASSPDLLIIDIGLPDGDGLRVCRALRESPGLAALPVLVITGSTRPEDRYRTFQVGADDFLQKPFDSFELLLRVRNRLERAGAQAAARQSPDSLRIGDLDLDLSSHQATVGEAKVHLTGSEFRILRCLMERGGKPVPSGALLSLALGYREDLATPQVLRTHVRNLRRKLEADPGSPSRLVNIPGVGYRIKGPDDP